MARLGRAVAVDTPFHVTQRGNARRVIFERDEDHLVYLDLLRAACDLHRLSVVGYCLMSNHVHIVAIPRRNESMALALKLVHGRYAAYLNARHASSGDVWQGRYYSCPLGPTHFWAALRYTELNPVRAGIVRDATEYRWSTAAAHCGQSVAEAWLETEPFAAAWDTKGWRAYLSVKEEAEELASIRTNTHTGRPLGADEFVVELERNLGRRLAARKGGRPAKETADQAQRALTFGEE